MASPVDAFRGSGGRTSVGTAHDPILPNGNVGDLLIVAIRFGAAPGTVTFTGWNLLFTDNTDASDDVTNVYWRVATSATGASEPITLTSTSSTKSGWVAWRITGAADPTVTPPQASTRAIGTTTANTGNAPSISPTGGSKDYLFLTLLAQASATITGYTAPAGYANTRNGNTGSANAVATNCVICGASKQATAASEDAGAWTHPAAATGWTAFTIAIHPGAVVSTVTIGKAAAATVVRGVTPSATGAVAVTLGRVVGNYDTIVQADAPLAYFKLEDTGSTADEAMGGSDGTFVGTVTKGVAGPRAGMTAVDFDGDAGHVNATLAGVNTGAGTDVTVEWWQKWNGPAGDTGDAIAFVPNEGANYAVWYNGAGDYGFNTFNSDVWGVHDSVTPSVLGLGIWRHIVATFRGDNRNASRLWVDGVEKTLTFDNVEGPANDLATAFRIGRGAGPAHGWDGPISRVAVWNGVLAQQTIDRHFRSGTSRVFGVTVSGAAQAFTIGKVAAASTVRGVTPAATGAAAVTIGKRAAAQTVRGVTPSGTGTATLTIGKKLAATTVRGVTPSGTGTTAFTIGRKTAASLVRGVTLSGVGTATLPVGKRVQATVVRGVTPSGVGTVAFTIGRSAAASAVRGVTPSGAGTVAFTLGKAAAASVVRGVTVIPAPAAIPIGKVAAASAVRGVTPSGVGTTAFTIGKRTTAIAVRGVTLAPTGVAPVPIGKVTAASGVRGVTPVGTGLAAPLAIGKRAQALAVRGLTLAPTGAAAVPLGKRLAAPTVRGVSLAATGAASITLGKRTQALTVRGVGITAAGQIALGVRAATTVVRGVTLVPLTVAVTVGKVASSSAVRGLTLTGGAATVPLGRRTATTTVRGVTLTAVGVAPLALGKRAANLSVRGLTVSGAGAVLVPLGKRTASTTVRGLTLVPAPATITLGRRAATTTVRGVTLVGGLAILGIGRVTSSTLVRGITTVPGVVALGLGRVPSTTTVYGVELIWVTVTVPGKLSATSGSGSSLTASSSRGLAGRLTSSSSQASVASSSRPASSGSLGLRDTPLGETGIETIGSA